MVKLDPVNVPELTGKVIFVTGGTAGLGKGTVATLAQHHPAHVYFSGRNTASAEKAIADIKKANPDASVSFLKCDLASLESVDEAAREFLAHSKRLDVLICNAGIMALPGSTTTDGYEIQMGTNHLGHALLIKHLLPTLLSTASEHGDARIVSLTSTAFRIAPSQGIIFKDLQSPGAGGITGRWARYGQSKLANIAYVQALRKRYPQLSVVAVHPGMIWTDLLGTLGFADRAFLWVLALGKTLDAEQGTLNSLWAATVDKERLVADDANYYEPVGVKGVANKLSADEKLATELWDWTQDQLKDHKV